MAIEAFAAGHGYYAGAGADFFGGVDGVLEFAAGADQDDFEGAGFFDADVTAFGGAFATGFDRDIVERGDFWRVILLRK